MNLDSLKLFKDLAETRSVSRAATLNEITQSAASQQVQELERNLGANLLDRTTRPLAITPEGRLFAEFCSDVLRRKHELDDALASLRKSVEGSVRIASIYSVGLSELVHLEKEYHVRYPQTEVSVKYLQPAKVYAAVLADQVDFGLVSYPETTKDIAVIPWRKEDMVLATAPDHPLVRKAAALQGPLPLQDLNGVAFIGFDEELPIRRHVDRFLKDNGVEVNLTISFDNIEMVKEAVAHRVGISILPFRSIRHDIRQKRLSAVRLAGGGLQRPLGIIHRKKKRFHRASQAFLDLLLAAPVAEAGGKSGTPATGA